MARGNPDNPRAAAHRKRAEAALAQLVDRRQRVTFCGLAKAAGVSIDFLYRSPLRPRIEQLRATAPVAAATPSDERATSSDSQVVHTLAAQLRELRRRHHDAIIELRNALAVAHGENLKLRRQLGSAPRQPSPPAS